MTASCILQFRGGLRPSHEISSPPAQRLRRSGVTRSLACLAVRCWGGPSYGRPVLVWWRLVVVGGHDQVFGKVLERRHPSHLVIQQRHEHHVEVLVQVEDL